jgi:hypothetical protein
MRLNEDAPYSYNRYIEYLSYKASEVFTLKSEAEDKVRQDERLKAKIELAENAILKDFDNTVTSDLTGLTTEPIEKVRTNLAKKQLCLTT